VATGGETGAAGFRSTGGAAAESTKFGDETELLADDEPSEFEEETEPLAAGDNEPELRAERGSPEPVRTELEKCEE
jgi:hypothetical protein